jgi:hypothetical protein
VKLELQNNKDFWAGLMFIGIGATAMLIARDYRFGTALHMGPGYFPSVLGGILILFGIYVAVRGLYSKEKMQGPWPFRALIVLPLSIALFGALMKYAGLIPALAALIFGSAAAGREFKFVDILLMTVLLTVLSVALFIWGLGLPYPLINLF